MIVNSIIKMAQDMDIAYEILENDDKTEIEYVYHISDIHVRSKERHTEYNEVFNRTFAKLNELIGNNTKKSVIVLTGDITHTKTEISPETVRIVRKFLKKLAVIATVILIAGNHDCCMTNKDRLDVLSIVVGDTDGYDEDDDNIYQDPVIIKKCKHTIFYLKKTGFYRYHNIIFGVTSIYSEFFLTADMVEKRFLKKVTQKNRYMIALYHDTIDNSIIDSGQKLQSEHLNAGDFNGYDYVFLGDIHKFQYMNQ